MKLRLELFVEDIVCQRRLIKVTYLLEKMK